MSNDTTDHWSKQSRWPNDTKNHFKATALPSVVIKSHQDILCLGPVGTPRGAHMPYYPGDQPLPLKHHLSSHQLLIHHSYDVRITSSEHNGLIWSSRGTMVWMTMLPPWQAPVVCLLMRRVGGQRREWGRRSQSSPASGLLSALVKRNNRGQLWARKWHCSSVDKPARLIIRLLFGFASDSDSVSDKLN